MTEGRYVVRLTYAANYQDWPDVFGPFESYDDAATFTTEQAGNEYVVGTCVYLLRGIRAARDTLAGSTDE